MVKRFVALFVFCVVAWSLAAQDKTEFWPGAGYDPRIPTFREALGYEPGERITTAEGIVKYFETIERASGGRLKVFDYGKSWEGRRLVYAALGSPANMKQVAEIRAGMQKLADPRKLQEAEAKRLMASLPAVIWLAYGVHGNEISSPEAAMLAVYHLLAARNDKLAERVLANVLVLIDPLQNPDGHDRFVHHFEEALGLEPDASPVAAEHAEPWPGGRSNHYYFDMNRDWFAVTQPETRGRVRVLQQWYPLAFVDLHEMGSDSTYYFAPTSAPYNPYLTKDQLDGFQLFGKGNARWFDRFGYDYFTREVFDAFYPGYGDSWPAYYGAIGMTYENATVRGLVVRRSDDSILTFRQSVKKHFVASIATLETAAENRQKLIEQWYRYRQTAVEEGSKEAVREYILPRRGDTSAVDKLAAVLGEQGVELRRATAPFRNAGKEYPAGSYVISLAQPAKRLIRVLLDTSVNMDEAFVKEQERRRKKKLSDEVYDVTAWSLPLVYNVEAVGCGESSRGTFEPVKPVMVPPGAVTGGRAEVAYLAPWGTQAAARLLAAAWRDGLRVLSSDKTFTQNGRKYPSGTLIFKVLDNPRELADKLGKLAASTGAEIVASNTSWVDDGVNFGSRNVVLLKRPTIALAWDTPTSSASAGATRFVIERQYGHPVTPVRTQNLGTADLSKFQTLILPEAGFGAGYSQALGASGVQRLKEWVSSGGTLVGVGSAVAFLADPRVGLLAVQQELLPRPAGEAARRPEGAAGTGPGERATAPASSAAPSAAPAAAPSAATAAEGRTPGKLLATEEDYLKAIQADSDMPDRALGVLVKARLDPDHWVTAGLGETVAVLVSGRSIFTPIKLDKGVNAAVFLGPKELVASGYLWEENRKQLAYKPFVIVQRDGRGTVIGFTADPNFRAYMDGLNVLFLNAVFRGPAHARAAGSREVEDWGAGQRQ
jgi:hypothetical protein